MELNGVLKPVWMSQQVFLQGPSSTEHQFQDPTHIGKKRKLTLTDGDESPVAFSFIESNYGQMNMMNNSNGLFITNGHHNSHSHLTNDHFKRQISMYESSLVTTPYQQNYPPISRNTHYPQDVMGNPLSDGEDSSEELQPIEKVKKKRKEKNRDKDCERDRKRDLINLDESSDASTSTSKVEHEKKEPRIGMTYQCDMSVLDNGEGDRLEFIGEQIWDPSKVSLESVENLLQDVKLTKPLINQFEFEPFFEYIPSTSIIALDKLLMLLKKWNYNIEKTMKYLMEKKLDFSDRGFSVRQQWKIGDIKTFEKALKFMFEEEGEFDLGDVKRAMPSKPMTQICEFYYAWKHSKRFQTWKEETNRTEFTNRKRSKAGLREVRRVDYNDQTSLILSNLNNRPHKPQKKPLEDSKVLQTISNEGDYMVYDIVVNVQINDPEFERKNCSKYVTRRNVKTDKYFLEYS
jgi:hypothetical protein